MLERARVLGSDNLQRLKKQFEEMQEGRQRIIELEKDKAELKVVEEKLRDQYQKMYDRNTEYRFEVIDVKKKIVRAQRKIELLQAEIDEILDIIDPD